ncbi:hypothetical protein RHGRI_003695 [Rhododendron griersonianum]|uniref:EF-hand domain-containing protein n=1 Tax=Rhododendron griersonianum TaxID=479676 RepID=A0AAV6L6R8_9ERIC|nr:hypothetical protein RHGRI_003695 [Rhododendron griersonianum]
MEEMQGAAMAYYANMPNNQQQMVRSFYESIDRNGDGKVSIQEYSVFLAEKGYKQCMPPNLFKLLDRNNDGTLDFEECVTFFYMITCNRLVICKGCESYLWGLHFLCVECYNDIKTSEVADVRSDYVGSLEDVPKNMLAIMEDLVKTAGLYYEKSSLDIQEAADNFFYVLDNDKDGKVNLREFLSFMRQQGHVKLRSSRFFKELDKDGKGLLEFKEPSLSLTIVEDDAPYEPTPPSSSLTITEDLTSTTNDDAPYEPTLPSSSVIAEYRTSTSIDYEPRPQWLNLPHKAAEAVVIAGALKALDLLVDSAGANCTIM